MLGFDGITGVLAEAQGVATELGIDSWQLVAGSYNGVVFHVHKGTLGRLNDQFNPLAGVLDNAKSILGAVDSNNDNTNLTYGTNTVSTGISDITSRKLAIHSIPNGEDVLEDMGWNGDVYIITGIVYGAGYGNAMDNTLNSLLNDSNVPSSARNVLVHPILGTIPGITKIISYRKLHTPMKWRSVAYEMVFRTERPYGLLTTDFPSTTSQINNIISSSLAITTDLLGTWNEVSAIQNMFIESGNNVGLRQNVIKAQQSVQLSANAHTIAVKLLVSNLSPANYNNVQLNNTPTIPVSEVPFYYYFNKNMSESDVNSIVTVTNQLIETSIAEINAELDVDFIYDTISGLTRLESILVQLATSLLNSTYGTLIQYLVPYDMDLLTLCSINNLNYETQSDLVYRLNYKVMRSANFIPKGLILTIPKGSTRSNQRVTTY